MRSVVLMIGDPRYQSVWGRLPESVTSGLLRAPRPSTGCRCGSCSTCDPDTPTTFNDAMTRLTTLDWPTVAAA